MQRRLVETTEQAEKVGFTGSPTIRIDGTDPMDTMLTLCKRSETSASRLVPKSNTVVWDGPARKEGEGS